MNTIELARRAMELGQQDTAQNAYLLVLGEADSTPHDRLEAAYCILCTGGNYKIAYTTFQELYSNGHFCSETFAIMTDAFYTPNVKLQKNRYEKNVKLLKRYKYLFRKDFPNFDDLPVLFFPFDENSYLPFDNATAAFDTYFKPREPVVRHHFFADLEKPILAKDVFSQYELEYLRDNVRRSDWVGRENHIYLHYSNWGVFCSYLQVLNLRSVLEEDKVVFLIEDEIGQYPIDFKARFGIDYSQYPVKPFGIREINKLIWHTQLATHNGGDFFNEILYGHPNLLTDESRMLDTTLENIERIKSVAIEIKESKGGKIWDGEKDKFDETVLNSLVRLENITDKDVLVAVHLSYSVTGWHLDRESRIVPAILIQPHFSNIYTGWKLHSRGGLFVETDVYTKLIAAGLFQQFKYIKTFTPMRRPTTSFAATVKFMWNRINAEKKPEESGTASIMDDGLTTRALNRTFMVDWQDRFYKDSRLVRFEDGKLNPKATFTALAAFLDVPYTESMTYCSSGKGINPESLEGNAIGFDPSRIYEKYEAYADDYERTYLEYVMRDVYAYYKYDFQYYDGSPMTEDDITELVEKCAAQDDYVRKSCIPVIVRQLTEKTEKTQEEIKNEAEEAVKQMILEQHTTHRKIALLLSKDLLFYNKNGQPLRFMTPLELEESLLEAPLYH